MDDSFRQRGGGQLPAFIAKLNLTARSFILIATEEFVLLILIALLLPPVWFAGATIAYTVHVAVHCVQMILTHLRGIPLRLWSAPLQLPIASLIVAMMPASAVSPVNEPVGLATASVIMTAVMVVNLVLAHAVVGQMERK